MGLLKRIPALIMATVVAKVGRGLARKIASQSEKNNRGKPTGLSQALDAVAGRR